MGNETVLIIVGGVIVALGIILGAKKALDDLFVSRKDFEKCQVEGKEFYRDMERKIDSLESTQQLLVLAICKANNLNPKDFLQ